MKSIKSIIVSLMLMLGIISSQAQDTQLRVIPQTSAFARQLLTNESAAEWIVILQMGTNYFFGNFAQLNASNNWSGTNVMTNWANVFAGNGAGVSNLNVAFLQSGTVAAALSLTNTNNLYIGSTFEGNGGLLTNLQGGMVVGVIPVASVPASVPLINIYNAWSSSNNFAGQVIATNTNNVLAGNGAGVTNIAASNIVSGPVKAALTLSNTANVFTGNGSAITSLTPANINSGTWSFGSIANGGSLAASTLSASTSATASIFAGITAVPIITAGTGAGTSPTITADSTSSGVAMTVTILTGSTPSASSTVCSIAFAPSLYGSTPHIAMSPMNAAAGALSGTGAVYVSSITTSGFSLAVGSSALAAATTYKFSFVLIQ